MTNDFTPERHHLSKEEYAKIKKDEKNKVYQMVDKAALEIINDPDKFKAFLDTQSTLDRYSAVNALLIYHQYPQATKLKEFIDWSKEKVKVRKGAKSICILEPIEYIKRDGSTGISYNVKRVFDVSQTSATKAPAPSMNRDPKNLITVMLDSSPVEVASTHELPLPNQAAYYDNNQQVLFIKKGVGDSILVAQSIAQELAHAQLSIQSREYSRNENGFMATCIGYMLCKKYGIDTSNFAVNRIPESLKSKEPKEIRAELSKMRNAMSEIHSCINDELYKQKLARQRDFER